MTNHFPPAEKIPPPSLHVGQFPWKKGGTGSAGTISAADVAPGTTPSKSGVSCET